MPFVGHGVGDRHQHGRDRHVRRQPRPTQPQSTMTEDTKHGVLGHMCEFANHDPQPRHGLRRDFGKQPFQQRPQESRGILNRSRPGRHRKYEEHPHGHRPPCPHSLHPSPLSAPVLSPNLSAWIPIRFNIPRCRLQSGVSFGARTRRPGRSEPPPLPARTKGRSCSKCRFPSFNVEPNRRPRQEPSSWP